MSLIIYPRIIMATRDKKHRSMTDVQVTRVSTAQSMPKPFWPQRNKEASKIMVSKPYSWCTLRKSTCELKSKQKSASKCAI